jgi:hypothetical protein
LFALESKDRGRSLQKTAVTDVVDAAVLLPQSISVAIAVAVSLASNEPAGRRWFRVAIIAGKLETGVLSRQFCLADVKFCRAFSKPVVALQPVSGYRVIPAKRCDKRSFPNGGGPLRQLKQLNSY